MPSALIKFIIICTVLVGLVIGTYFAAQEFKKRCPEGLMACIELNDLFGPDSNGEVSGGADPTPPGAAPASYAACKNYLMASTTLKCRTPREVGVAWTWSQSAGSVACAAAVRSWNIDISSSGGSTVYTYTLTGGEKRAFKLANAPDFVAENLVTFKITPLDVSNKPVTPALVIEVTHGDTGTQACADFGTAAGTPVNFVDLKFKAAELPPVDPVDCAVTPLPRTKCIFMGTLPTGQTKPFCGSDGESYNKHVVTRERQGSGKPCPPITGTTCRLSLEDGDDCVPRGANDPTVGSCSLTAAYYNITDATHVRNVIANKVSTQPGGASTLEFDTSPFTKLEDATSIDGSQISCTKAFRNPGEKPGVAIQTRLFGNIWDKLGDMGCTYPSDAGDKFRLIPCNDFAPCTWIKEKTGCNDSMGTFTWKKDNPNNISSVHCPTAPTPLTFEEADGDCYKQVYGRMPCDLLGGRANYRTCEGFPYCMSEEFDNETYCTEDTRLSEAQIDRAKINTGDVRCGDYRDAYYNKAIKADGIGNCVQVP